MQQEGLVIMAMEYGSTKYLSMKRGLVTMAMEYCSTKHLSMKRAIWQQNNRKYWAFIYMKIYQCK